VSRVDKSHLKHPWSKWCRLFPLFTLKTAQVDHALISISDNRRRDSIYNYKSYAKILSGEQQLLIRYSFLPFCISAGCIYSSLSPLNMQRIAALHIAAEGKYFLRGLSSLCGRYCQSIVKSGGMAYDRGWKIVGNVLHFLCGLMRGSISLLIRARSVVVSLEAISLNALRICQRDRNIFT